MIEVLLNKIDENPIISAFNVGEHVLGRGPNLGCDTKKVSRKHGLLKVTAEERVSLSSTNNNPCFYQSSKDRSISLVTFGKTVELHDGDKIALSLDHGWFKVQIRKCVNNNNDIQNENIPSFSGNVSNPTKRALGTDEDEITNKKQKMNEPDTMPLENIKQESEASEIKSEPLDTTDLDTSESFKVNVCNFSVNNCTVNINLEPVEEQPIQKIKEENISSDIDEMEENSELDLLQGWNDLETTKQNSIAMENSITIENDSNAIKENKNVEAEEVNGINSSSIKIENDSIKIETNSSEDAEELKKENASTIKTEDDENKVDDSSEKNKGLKADKPDSGTDTEASTSGTTNRVWRDRCWYGNSCYRKNPAHRAEFSHPNDSDYDSDSQDPRPICCYGVNCYRKSKEHRKRYQHPGQARLGPRPANARPKRQTNTKNKKPQQTKKPSATYSDSEDSYDYSDPFLNDGSSDDYEPSESSETESDYEDDVKEDNKRLLKEARNFRKKP